MQSDEVDTDTSHDNINNYLIFKMVIKMFQIQLPDRYYNYQS